MKIQQALWMGTLATAFQMESPRAGEVETKGETLKVNVDTIALVLDVTGASEYSYDQSNWKVLSEGKVLKAGASLRSGPMDAATIQVDSEGAFVRLAPGGSLRLVADDSPAKQFEPITRAPYATIRSLRGGAEIFSRGAWRMARVNERVEKGTILRTNKGSMLDLYFHEEGLMVRMKPKTTIRVERLEPSEETGARAHDVVFIAACGKVLTNGRTVGPLAQYEMKPGRLFQRIGQD